MATILREDVERVALLARLSLTEAEAEQMTAELATILGYVDTLDELDTQGIEPMAHPLPLATPLRDDSATETISPDLAVANAPERAGSAFVVPKVIDAEDDG
jgi:aspartyl-tRNA(Asn)/glutamyl-tRNA(Gln) amidotransferase subunit C